MGAVCGSEKRTSKYRPDEPSKATGTHNVAKPIVGAEVPVRFKVQIDTIKARNIPISSCYFKISFGREKTFTTQRETLYSGNHNWAFKEEFEFNTTRGGLREMSMQLLLMDGYDQELGHVVVSLHDIATGPTEHDFPVVFKKAQKEVARINFTVKMFQKIHMSIKTKKIVCKLNDGLKEKNYNFSLKLKTKGREFSSEHSNNFRNQAIALLSEKTQELGAGDIENYQQGMDEENRQINIRHVTPNPAMLAEAKSPEKFAEKSQSETIETTTAQENPSFSINVERRERGNTMKDRGKLTSQPAVGVKKDIVFDYPENSDSATTPFLDMDVSIKELVTGSFQFFLWTNKEGGLNDSQASADEVYIDHKLLAECYIGMTKFFFSQAEINFGEDNQGVPGLPMQETSTFNESQKRTAKFNEKLWFHGAGIGELSSEFILENTGFYKQMIYGVRTEEGVQKVGSIYANKDASALGLVKTADIKEVKSLEVYKDSLKAMIPNLTNPKLVPKTRNLLLNDMKDTQYKILDTLKALNQDVTLTFAYKTPDSLLTSQKILLDVSRSLIETADQMPIHIRPLSYENLSLLINRFEFELNSMGFNEAYADFIKNPGKQGSAGPQKIDQKILQRKYEACIEYQALLYLLLQKTIGKTNEKGTPEKEREFIELFNAQAYFRIPEFRTKLLECFLKEDDKISMNEWRGTDWVLDDNATDQKRNEYFVSLFDWEKDFFAYIKDTEQGKKNYETLSKILNNPEWQEKMSKKGINFYNYLTEWANAVDRTLVIKENIPWQDIPGYTTLIKSFFIDLKTKDVRYYPEGLIQASCALLRNVKLLNTFVSIVYKKTSLYDSSSVFAVYELVNKWFAVIIENNKSIPSTFDFGFFFKGLYMVLEGEHALNVALALLVIYNNFNLFPYSEKQQLSEYLFSKLFFKLFLHWSWIVRQVFHHVLLYRFYHQHRKTNTNLKDLDDLKKELLLYNQQRESHKKDKKLLVNDFINMEYARNMTIIENAYNKYSEEKKRSQYEKKLPTKMKPLPKLKYASSINLRGFLESEDFKQDSSSNAMTPMSSTKQTVNPNDSARQKLITYGGELSGEDKKAVLGANVDPSCWVINPDRLDVAVAKDVKPEVIKPSRSESMSYGLKSVLEEAQSGTAGRSNLAAKDPKTKDEGEDGHYERINDKNDKKKVIHRRVMYFDKQTNEMKEIPKEYLVYLQASYQEFEKTKEQYLKWLNQGVANEKLGRAAQKVPELIVKIPLDDLEGGQGPSKEW